MDKIKKGYLVQIISDCTRAKREGEFSYSEGDSILTTKADYRFLSEEEFHAKEHLQTVFAYGAWRGAATDLFLKATEAMRQRAPEAEALDIVFVLGTSGSGKSSIRNYVNENSNMGPKRDTFYQAILPQSISDVMEGIVKVKERAGAEFEAKVMFIDVDQDVLRERMEKRGSSEKEISARLETASKEIASYKAFIKKLSEEGIPCSIIDGNKSIESSAQEMLAAIERLRGVRIDNNIAKKIKIAWEGVSNEKKRPISIPVKEKIKGLSKE